MPVFVSGVPRYEIKPPTTMGDKGKPTDSLPEDMRRLFCLIDDERHLTAHKLYEDIHRRIKDWEKLHASESHPKHKKSKGLHVGGFGSKHKKEVAAAKEKKTKEMKDAQDMLDSKHKEIDKLQVRYERSVTSSRGKSMQIPPCICEGTKYVTHVVPFFPDPKESLPYLPQSTT